MPAKERPPGPIRDNEWFFSTDVSPMLCGAHLEQTCVRCISHIKTSMDFLRFYIKMFMLRCQPTCGSKNSEASCVPLALCSPAAREVI